MQNIPAIKLGITGVSRDCFPIELTRRRLAAVVKACQKRKIAVEVCSVIIESERDAIAAAAEMKAKGVNACALYLGNFGPEGPTTIFARELGVPFMLCAAAEESRHDLIGGRGDAYCGLLNASLNCGLRHLKPYIPPVPVGLPDQVAVMMTHFVRMARVITGVKHLKVFSFGPRPQDFYACNAPIQPLYDLGIEVMENSELDLQTLFNRVKPGRETRAIEADMARELGPKGNRYPEKLTALARFEVALLRFHEENLGSRRYAVFANKCWPAFEHAFGFVPCYVNSRLAARGIPVACEVDIYGAVSQYLAQLASFAPATLLDINNTVPADLPVKNLRGAAREDLFMGFHCGNTPSCCLCEGCGMKHQLIMHRLLEPDKKPDITCGTLEGTLRPGPATLFRLQSTTGGQLHSYIAEGHVLDADPSSFGGIGIFGIPGMARFYRHVLIEKQFPHHTAIGFEHIGRILFDAMRLTGITAIETPRPTNVRYPSESPFA